MGGLSGTQEQSLILSRLFCLSVHLSIREEADALKCALCRLIGLNCLMVWFVDLKEEDLFLDDVATVWCDRLSAFQLYRSCALAVS